MTFVQFNHLNLRHHSTEKAALLDVSFNVDQGDVIVLLGRNGSGKSTLLKVLTQQLKLTSGNVILDGKEINDYAANQLSRQVIMLNQNSDESLFPTLTVYENFSVMSQHHTFSTQHHKQLFIDILQTVNKNLVNKLTLPVHRLSGGEKQALVLALAFINPPKILLLDEHTSALDPKTSAHLMALTQKLITQHQMTCIMTTHDLDIALTYGNRLIILQDGQIIKMMDAKEKSALNKQQLINEYY